MLATNTKSLQIKEQKIALLVTALGDNTLRFSVVFQKVC